MSELDKFKRRLIRSVARLMLFEKKSDEELWAQMKKETGCDCKVLWERMRALTIKKLKRQLASDDKMDGIASVARMSLTDWLLFDLVLVHEKIDLIGKDILQATKKDMKALVNLFELVCMFEVEGQRGDALADAWTGATVHYNSLGYQCSPMLLQRRWYQLKELTRERFYSFWFKYRGNVKKISESAEAQEIMPTPLLTNLAKMYPDVITHPFPEWEKLIEQRLVIMPQEFENKMREHMPMRPINDAEPEIILVEPVVETIDLSDSENVSEKPNYNIKLAPAIKIKTEPKDDDGVNDIMEVCNADMLDAIQDTTAEEQAISECDLDKNSEGHTDLVPETDDPAQNISESENECMDSDEVVLPQISNVFGNVDMNDETLSRLDSMSHRLTEANVDGGSLVIGDTSNEMEGTTLHRSIKKEHETSEIVRTPISDDTQVLTSTQDVDTVTEVPAENTLRSVDITSHIQTVSSFNERLRKTPFQEINDINNTNTHLDDALPQNDDAPTENLDDIEDDIIQIKTEVTNAPDVLDFESFCVIPTDLEYADEGIEFVDGDETTSDKHTSEVTSNGVEQKDVDTPKFDLKLLMDPVVVVKKIDNVSVLKDVVIENDFSVATKFLIDCIEKECQAVRSIIDNTQMLPVKDGAIAMCVQQIKKEIFASEPDESDDDEISDAQRVKLSSYLLQKPKSRSYNPIKLCKNPDFNTRLKRLSFGFFSSMRNCKLLKRCKPMTIDVHKAFESKLIAGTLYLKTNETHPVPTNNQEGEIEQTSSVLPSAMSVQTLINCTVNSAARKFAITSHDNAEESVPFTDRKKVINLPDITEVRRINRKLLTAEVTPIQVQNDFKNVQNSSIVADIPAVNLANSVETSELISRNEKPVDDVHVSSNFPVEIKNAIENISVPYEGHSTDCNTESSTALKLRNTIQEIDATENEIIKTAQAPQVIETPPVSKEKEPKEDIPSTDMRSKHRTYRRPYTLLPWVQKSRLSTLQKDDILLTMDSLVKMLNVLSEESEEPENNPKALRQLRHKANSRKLTTASCDLKKTKPTENCQVSEDQKSNENDKSIKTNEQNSVKTQRKPRIRVSHAVNGRRYKNGKYCCWSREIYSKRNTVLAKYEKHPCPPENCECCCKYVNFCNIADADDNSGDPQTIRACESIESVVRQTQEVGVSTDSPPLSQSIIDDVQDKVSNEVINLNVDTAQTSVALPRAGQIHIDTIDGEIRVTTSFDTNSIDVQGEITVNTTPDQPDYPNLIPKEMLVKSRKRVALLQKPPFEPPPEIVKPASNCYKQFAVKKQMETSPNIDDNLQRQIVIDGSSPQLTLPTLRTLRRQENHKVVYLKNTPGTEERLNRPISLGKNKILLTTVKLPRKITLYENISGAQLGLPRGVKLVLQPNGELIVCVDPGTQLTDDDLAMLPKILEAVQQQLKNDSNVSTQPNVAKDDVVTISDDENNCVANNAPTVLSEENALAGPSTNFEAQKEVSEPVAQGNVESQSEVVKEQVTEDQTKLCNSNDEQVNTDKQPQAVSSQFDQKLNADKSAHNVVSTDVSEVSSLICQEKGVVDESSQNTDTAPQTTTTQTELEIVGEQSAIDVNKDVETEDQAATSSKKTILSDLMEMSGISTEDTITTGQDGSVENIAPEPCTNIPIDGTSLIHELNPITCFDELKYAYELGGLFFKLDLETRLIVPINVCIKKQSRVPNSAKLGTQLAPKPVIDLTEDEDISLEEPTFKHSHLSRVLAHNVCNSIMQKHNNSAKPLKLYKAIHPNIVRRGRPRKNISTNLDKVKVPATNAPLRKRKARRKQNLDKIEVQIDLLDSDEPMEEEYLYESFGDSSDDEPLSKKVTRKSSNVTHIPKLRSLLKSNNMQTEPEIVAGSTEEVQPSHAETEMQVDNNPKHTGPHISFLSDHSDNENTNEDCILGV